MEHRRAGRTFSFGRKEKLIMIENDFVIQPTEQHPYFLFESEAFRQPDCQSDTRAIALRYSDPFC